ncbi:MAG: hypothetical protein JSW71_07325 [Gemmatimonadota bacterium]|nr:MAG: hypothetical protein JSW71_07325 [Gemmatimonadota bacterium]
MRHLLTAALMVLLLAGVAGSVASGTMGSFFDTEVSTDNQMHAGTRVIELSGGPITVDHAVPSKWHSEEYVLVNVGTLDAIATVHILNAESREAGSVNGLVYYGATSSYGSGSPVGVGVASSEPELVTEEGGQVGSVIVSGLGVDCGDDTGPPDMVMSRHVDVRMWFDKNDNGIFEESPDPNLNELIVDDKLFNLVCRVIELGPIPGGQAGNNGKGTWKTWFEYTLDDPLELPLMVGQFWPFGRVNVWNDDDFIYIDIDTTDSGWEMAATHAYVGLEPPDKLAPGSWTSVHDSVPPPGTHDLHQISLLPEWKSNGMVYVAVHAEGTDGETGVAFGETRRFKIEVHVQQIEDSLWPRDYDGDGDTDDDDAQKRWWPTNGLQGDTCTFDMMFDLDEP